MAVTGGEGVRVGVSPGVRVMGAGVVGIGSRVTVTEPSDGTPVAVTVAVTEMGVALGVTLVAGGAEVGVSVSPASTVAPGVALAAGVGVGLSPGLSAHSRPVRSAQMKRTAAPASICVIVRRDASCLNREAGTGWGEGRANG